MNIFAKALALILVLVFLFAMLRVVEEDDDE